MKASLSLECELAHVVQHTTGQPLFHAPNPTYCCQPCPDVAADAASAQSVEDQISDAAVSEAHTSEQPPPLGEERASVKAPAAETTSGEQVRGWC